MYLNKVTIIGNLTKDVELKSLPSGMTVISFSVATNRVSKDNSGNKKESVEFHNVVAFGKTAETIHKYVSKGHQIYLEGRLQTRSWDGQDGKKLYRTEIILETFQFGNNKQDSTPVVKKTTSKSTAKEKEEVEYPEDDINPEDIPF